MSFGNIYLMKRRDLEVFLNRTQKPFIAMRNHPHVSQLFIYITMTISKVNTEYETDNV